MHNAGSKRSSCTRSTVPSHDPPQRVGYRRAGRDSMVAWFEGEREGRKRRIEFPYRRVRCAGE